MAIEPRTTGAKSASEIQAEIDAAEAGATIHLPQGTIRGHLVIAKPLTLRGAGADSTMIEGKGLGPTIAVEAPDGDVRIEELGISGGKSASGGGVSIDNGARVHLVGCLLQNNLASSGRGGAVAVDFGSVSISECTLVLNRALIGGAVYAGGDAKVEIVASILAENSALKGGALAAADGAEVEIFTSRLENNQADSEGHHIFAYGTLSRRPSILVSNALLGVAGGPGLSISNSSAFKAELVIDNSTIGRELAAAFVVA